MTTVTAGVSASSFAANMAVKQNVLDFSMEYPQAAEVVEKSYYVDDGLTGADSPQEAIELQGQLLRPILQRRLSSLQVEFEQS